MSALSVTTVSESHTSFAQTVFDPTTQTPGIDANTNRFAANTNRFAANQGFTYDKGGNITNDPTDSGRSFVFNGDNKQIQVYKYGVTAPVGTYFYDGDGKRVKKISDNETTVFVYDGLGKLIAEYSNQIASTPTTGYTATDPLGSPRAITDKQGNIVSRRDFMPFGEELNAGTTNRTESAKYTLAGDTLRKKFTGYEKDVESGLDFAEARYYNNQHGRFTAVDPLLASGRSANPQSFNRFAYCLNIPTACADPTGLDPIWTYYVENGQQHYRMFNSQKEIDDANKILDTEFCKQNSCSKYETWKGGNWIIWDNRVGGYLRSDGKIDKFSMEGIGSDAQWKGLMSTWASGTLPIGGVWEKVFQVAYENNGATGVDNLNYALGGARYARDGGPVEEFNHIAPFIILLKLLLWIWLLCDEQQQKERRQVKPSEYDRQHLAILILG